MPRDSLPCHQHKRGYNAARGESAESQFSSLIRRGAAARLCGLVFGVDRRDLVHSSAHQTQPCSSTMTRHGLSRRIIGGKDARPAATIGKEQCAGRIENSLWLIFQIHNVNM